MFFLTTDFLPATGALAGAGTGFTVVFAAAVFADFITLLSNKCVSPLTRSSIVQECHTVCMPQSGIDAENFPCDIIGPFFYENDLLTERLPISGGKTLS